MGRDAEVRERYSSLCDRSQMRGGGKVMREGTPLSMGGRNMAQALLGPVSGGVVNAERELGWRHKGQSSRAGRAPGGSSSGSKVTGGPPLETMM